jgi:hypothetical protein
MDQLLAYALDVISRYEQSGTEQLRIEASIMQDWINKFR